MSISGYKGHPTVNCCEPPIVAEVGETAGASVELLYMPGVGCGTDLQKRIAGNPGSQSVDTETHTVSLTR